MASPIVAEIASILERLSASEQEHYLSMARGHNVRFDTDRDFFVVIDQSGNYLKLCASDGPENSDECWDVFKDRLGARVSSEVPEPIRQDVQKKIDILTTGLMEQKNQNFIERDHETRFSPKQKKNIEQTIAAFNTASEKLLNLRDFGIDCYAAAVVTTGAPPIPSDFAADLKAFAGAMGEKLKDAPRIGSKQEKVKTDRLVALRHGFLKTQPPYPMRPWDLDDMNLFLRTCGENPITRKTFKSDHQAIR